MKELNLLKESLKKNQYLKEIGLTSNLIILLNKIKKIIKSKMKGLLF
jgi:hypothetical protein